MGCTTANIQRFGRINLSGAAAIADAKRNKFFNRNSTSKSNETLRIFQQFEPEVQQVIVTVAMEDAPDSRPTPEEQQRSRAPGKSKKGERRDASGGKFEEGI